MKVLNGQRSKTRLWDPVGPPERGQGTPEFPCFCSLVFSLVSSHSPSAYCPFEGFTTYVLWVPLMGAGTRPLGLLCACA